MSALGNITADCDCKFSKIDVKNSIEAIKKDYFDCSCNSDSVDGIAILLNLSYEQQDWLGRFENIEVKSQICKFIKDSNYNDSSIKFANEIINQQILNPTLTFDINASYKSPYNIDLSSVSGKTPEEIKFKKIYTVLKNSELYKNLFVNLLNKTTELMSNLN